MQDEIVKMWEGGDESTCPHCGTEYEYITLETDEGHDGPVHWLTYHLECETCGGKWYVEYELANPKVYD